MRLEEVLIVDSLLDLLVAMTLNGSTLSQKGNPQLWLESLHLTRVHDGHAVPPDVKLESIKPLRHSADITMFIFFIILVPHSIVNCVCFFSCQNVDGMDIKD